VAEANDTGPLVRLSDVTKTYRLGEREVPVLAGIDLELRAGEALAILGPSGSGKSTLLHLLGALDRPTAGRIELGGRDLAGLDELALARLRNREIGFVFQDHHLLPQYTVLENVLLPTFAFGGPALPEAEARARALLERVGLGARLAHRPAELSGGERQRAAVARALVQRPALVLGDEPTGSLDRTNAAAVADLLFELQREQGNLLVVVTHSLELARRFPRRIELVEGRCVAA
jgi:lipoprotein-releasing system ATP-binding protein